MKLFISIIMLSVLSCAASQYVYAVRQLGRFISEENENVPDKRKHTIAELNLDLRRRRKLVKKAQAALTREHISPMLENADSEQLGIEASDVKRLNRLVYLSVLWAIHNRLETLTQSRTRHANEKKSSFKLQEVIAKLLKYTEECQENYSRYQ